MFVYKLVCKKTGKVHVGVSDYDPDLDILTFPENVKKDIDFFGINNFHILKICELNNRKKVEDKVALLVSKEKYCYNNDPDEVKIEPIEQIPEFYWE